MSFFLQIFATENIHTHTHTSPCYYWCISEKPMIFCLAILLWHIHVFSSNWFSVFAFVPMLESAFKIVMFLNITSASPTNRCGCCIELTHGVWRFTSKNEILLEIIALTLLKNRSPHDHLVLYQFISLIIQELVILECMGCEPCLEVLLYMGFSWNLWILLLSLGKMVLNV